MLPSKPLYGNDKKPSSSDNDPIDNNSLPPPPPYSEYSSSSHNGSNYGNGYHERTPTAPPASLLNPTPAAVANQNHPFHYPMPSNNPNWPNNNNYGSMNPPPSTRHVPDVDDYIDNNNNNSAQQDQQPLLPSSSTPPPPPPPFYKKLSNYYKSNPYVNYIKTHWTFNGVIYTLFFIFMFIWIICSRHNNNDDDDRPSEQIHMPSPYPFTPTHYEYANDDTKRMTDFPASTLSTLAIDFTSHTGELHLVPTDDPVSWISFTCQFCNRGDAVILSTEFNLHNKTQLDITIHKGNNNKGRLIAVLHVSPNDRQHARLIIKVDTMMVNALTSDPKNMIQDLDLTLKGARIGFSLPDGPQGWKGKNLRVKLQGNNGSFGVTRLEATGTIELELTGVAGGDLELQQSIIAKHIKLSSRNGRVVMATAQASMIADTIDLTTTNSKLAVASIQARKQCLLRTQNGSIDVNLLPPVDGNELDILDVQSQNSGIHITTKTLIKRASIASELGSITMHATQDFDGLFDIQSALSKTTIQDYQNGKIHLDVSGTTIKQGRRGNGNRDHQIKLFSYAGSSNLVFNQ